MEEERRRQYEEYRIQYPQATDDELISIFGVPSAILGNNHQMIDDTEINSDLELKKSQEDFSKLLDKLSELLKENVEEENEDIAEDNDEMTEENEEEDYEDENKLTALSVEDQDENTYVADVDDNFGEDAAFNAQVPEYNIENDEVTETDYDSQIKENNLQADNAIDAKNIIDEESNKILLHKKLRASLKHQLFRMVYTETEMKSFE